MGLAEIRAIKMQVLIPKPKKVHIIQKVSDKRKRQLQEWKDMNTDEGLDKWFEARRKEMTGICAHCGGKSCKDSDEYYKFSLAHILPKRNNMFPSVATNEKNWIELCFWGESCHTNFDNFTLDITDLNCFDLVIERFVAMYPFIAQEEKKRIPSILMNYIDIP